MVEIRRSDFRERDTDEPGAEVVALDLAGGDEGMEIGTGHAEAFGESGDGYEVYRDGSVDAEFESCEGGVATDLGEGESFAHCGGWDHRDLIFHRDRVW